MPERVQFARSSIKISGRWGAIFTRIAATDRYIVGLDVAVLFHSVLTGLLGELPPGYFSRCRSITIQHKEDHFDPGLAAGLQTIGERIRDIIRHLSLRSDIPYLRRISIELENHPMESIFQRNYSLFACFPAQVTELEVKFSYSEATNSVVWIRSHDFREFGLKSAELSAATGLKKLTVLGASCGVAKELLGVFVGESRVESFEQDAWKDSVPTSSPETALDVEGGEEEEENESVLDAEAGSESHRYGLTRTQSEREDEEEAERRYKLRSHVFESNYLTPTGCSRFPPVRKRGLGKRIACALKRWTRRGQRPSFDYTI
ncbi:hypothetical protein V5O48_010636 [Marasmius crinis-equi]|uniref:Uncharacterized protein n=1 Tax=Marasmius crinis-equi TaxID=585013 RepID=A0ABR3F7V0_9AGAR